MAAIVNYGRGLRQPLVRAAKDNQSMIGRGWQVAWIIALVVAGLCITGAAKDLGTTDYIKKLFDECKVFEASCYISLGLFVSYVLFGRLNNLRFNTWLYRKAARAMIDSEKLAVKSIATAGGNIHAADDEDSDGDDGEPVRRVINTGDKVLSAKNTASSGTNTDTSGTNDGEDHYAGY